MYDNAHQSQFRKVKKIYAYVRSFRLRTLPLSLAGIITGSLLALSGGNFNRLAFIWAILTTLSLQILANLCNEIGDLKKGTDNIHRLGPIRSIQSGMLNSKEFKRVILIFIILSCISGCFLIGSAFSDLLTPIPLIFALLGILSIFAAIKYTVGKRAYGYHGWGDISVLVFFGWLSVAGSYFIMTKNITPSIFLPATSIGFLSVAVLNMNNIRDMENDKACNKRTIPVIIGIRKAKIYEYCLVISAILLLLIYVLCTRSNSWKFYVFLITTPLFIRHLYNTATRSGKNLDGELRLLSLATLLCSLTFSLGQIF